MTIGTGIFLSILSICITIIILRFSKLIEDYKHEKLYKHRTKS